MVVESGCISSVLLSVPCVIVALPSRPLLSLRLLANRSTKKYLHGYSSWLPLGFPCSLLGEAALGVAPLAFSWECFFIIFYSLFALFMKSEHGADYFVWLLVL